jgi:hypothetical protein
MKMKAELLGYSMLTGRFLPVVVLFPRKGSITGRKESEVDGGTKL